MSRTRAHAKERNKPRLQMIRHDTGGVSVALDDDLRPLVEATSARRSPRAGSPVKSFSLAWDETEALGITADMRRSGPGMLSDQDRKDTLYQAYLQSVWISACVDVIAKRITSGGYVIEYIGPNNQPTPAEEAQKEELDTFLKHINDDEDFLALVRGHLTDLGIYGESYLEIVQQGGKPYELYSIDCTTMNYKLDKHGRITGYVQNMTHSTETVTFEPEEVIRWWLPDPKAKKKALSPIERILGSVDSDVHMADWARAFFRKGARPNFWIKFDGPREEADRFVVWLRENYTGMANAHVPLILYDGAELYEIGKGSVDIDFGKGREIAKMEILAGYQVPPAILAQIESAHLGSGTGESQEKSFLHNVCDPLKGLFFEKFNDRIVKKGFGITCWRVSTRYADYRADETISKIQDIEIRNGSLNINEVRAEQGKHPVKGGDANVIITTREVTAVGRLTELEDEQRQQAEVAVQHAQAQVELTKAQADKLKEPPPPVPPQMPPTGGTEMPPNNLQGNAPATSKEDITSRLEALIERLDRQAYTEDVHAEVERLFADLLNRYRQMAPESPPRAEESTLPLAYLSRVNEALDGVEEIRRSIQAKDVTPRKRNPRRKSMEIVREEEMVSQQGTCDCEICRGNHGKTVTEKPPYHDGCDCELVPKGTEHVPHRIVDSPSESEQEPHTGIMVAFILDPETARQLAIPGGEPAHVLHITLAFLGDKNEVELDLDQLKLELASFASESPPLQGTIGGFGRFTPSDSSEGKSPVIALVNVPGLQVWRAALVKRIEITGVDVAKDFDYTPHITLAYIDKDAPLPIESIPNVPLVFDRLTLCIGDEYTSFPLGKEPIEGTQPSAALTEELARWRERALEDVETRAWRGFTTTIIPESLHVFISRGLENCMDRSDVHGLFEHVYGDFVLTGTLPVSESAPDEQPVSEASVMNKDALKNRIHEILSNVAERGHMALSEESEQ